MVARTHASPWLLNANCVKEPTFQDITLPNKDTDCPKFDQEVSADQTENDSNIYEPPRKKAHLELKNAESLTDTENSAFPIFQSNAGSMQMLSTTYTGKDNRLSLSFYCV